MKKAGIYVHIPFCIHKCYYCDFLSGPADEDTQKSYFDALSREIEETEVFQVPTVFIGGGTPTAVDAKYITALMHHLQAHFQLEPDAEITIECNPGTVDEKKLCQYRTAGINRISIGLQSMDDRELKRLGRIHSCEQFQKTYADARKAGFANINIDLMSALPGQTLASFRKTLEQTVALMPEHISVYSLMIEEGTPFYERQSSLQLPTEETEYEIYRYTREYLKQKNYCRYEISNYAKKGFECRHNKTYWKRGSYRGFGIGAASLLELGEMENYRFSNLRSLQEYLKCMSENLPEFPFSAAVDRESIEKLTPSSRMEEFMFLGLRMTAGIRANQFAQCFGSTVEEIYGDVLCKLEKQELLTRTQEGEDIRIALTERGLDVSNQVLAEFLL